MRTFIILGVFVGLAIANPVVKIVNGTEAIEGEFPFVVSIRYDGLHTCAGTILDETHILSAAHCVNGRSNEPDRFSVVYGSVDLNEEINVSDVEEITFHQGYNVQSRYNDISILKLSKALVFGPNIQPTVLPKLNDPTLELATCTFVGWGSSEKHGPLSNILQKANFLVYTDEECEQIYQERTYHTFNFCAGIPEGGNGICSGDSGSPILVNGVQIGLTSWIPYPCGGVPYPGVYTQLSTYVGWIKQHMT